MKDKMDLEAVTTDIAIAKLADRAPLLRAKRHTSYYDAFKKERASELRKAYKYARHTSQSRGLKENKEKNKKKSKKKTKIGKEARHHALSLLFSLSSHRLQLSRIHRTHSPLGGFHHIIAWSAKSDSLRTRNMRRVAPGRDHVHQFARQSLAATSETKRLAYTPQ